MMRSIVAIIFLSVSVLTHLASGFVQKPHHSLKSLQNPRKNVEYPLPTPLSHPISTQLYGIPKLFRWLVDLYPLIVESVGKGLTDKAMSVDNFYLDMNGEPLPFFNLHFLSTTIRLYQLNLTLLS